VLNFFCMTADWLTAVGTLGLALVAFATIFRDRLRELRWHPEWKVNFQSGRPDCNRILQISPSDSIETHYVRARIQNVGQAGAEDVEVSVVEVRKREADHVFRPIPMGTPWNLIWAHINSHVLPRLPVGSERHIDIGHVVDPEKRGLIPGEDRRGSDPLKTLFCLALFVKSNTTEYLLSPAEEYEIDFRVFAGNAKPSAIFTFHLNHRGKWFVDEASMYRDGLGMSMSHKG